MNYPNFEEEKKLWDQGYQFVVGLDEAGRGPLAGPVVAAAVSLQYCDALKYRSIVKLGLRDGKKLSEKQREFLYEKLANHKGVKWGIGLASEKVIDKINIFSATKMAMRNALKDLCHKFYDRNNYGMADFLLIDGNFALNGVKMPQKSIIKGDQKVFSVVAAGIIAKVTRDKLMQKIHHKYPNYGFDKHKGYGTFLHLQNLKNFGPCKAHRKSFYPVNNLA